MKSRESLISRHVDPIGQILPLLNCEFALFDRSVGGFLRFFTTGNVVSEGVSVDNLEALLVILKRSEGKGRVHSRFFELSDVNLCPLLRKHSL